MRVDDGFKVDRESRRTRCTSVPERGLNSTYAEDSTAPHLLPLAGRPTPRPILTGGQFILRKEVFKGVGIVKGKGSGIATQQQLALDKVLLVGSKVHIGQGSIKGVVAIAVKGEPNVPAEDLIDEKSLRFLSVAIPRPSVEALMMP